MKSFCAKSNRTVALLLNATAATRTPSLRTWVPRLRTTSAVNVRIRPYTPSALLLPLLPPAGEERVLALFAALHAGSSLADDD